MASRGDTAGSTRPRSRRSIAHVPRSRLTSGGDKENATTDIGAGRPPSGQQVTAGKDKKSRSKSLGPGGLDALQASNGNRRKVISSLNPAIQCCLREADDTHLCIVFCSGTFKVNPQANSSRFASTKHPHL